MGGSRVLSLAAGLAAVTLLGGTAFAAPAVTLRLSGALVVRDGQGGAHDVPLTGSQRALPGETIRYSLVAVNRGDEAALRLSPVARIPAGTAYVGATSGAPAQLEFSLDGTTFAARPLVTVHGPNGPQRRAAEPSQYVAVRWSGLGRLAPRATQTFDYTVRVR